MLSTEAKMDLIQGGDADCPDAKNPVEVDDPVQLPKVENPEADAGETVDGGTEATHQIAKPP